MSKLFFLFVLIFTIPNCLAGKEIEKIEEILTGFDRPAHLKILIQKFGIIEKWNIEADRETLLDIEYEWDYISRIYRAKNYKDIKVFDFCGKVENRTVEKSVDFVVSTLTISDKSNYYIYRWKNGKYIRTEVKERS